MLTRWALAMAALAAGCGGDIVFNESPPDADRTDATISDAGEILADADLRPARIYFDLQVEPLLLAVRPKGACVSCHEGDSAEDGTDFLGLNMADHYLALLAMPLLIGQTPAESALLTYGNHEGNGFCSSPGVPYSQCQSNEFVTLGEWIRMESTDE